jgi:hypothetical protein
MESKITEVRFLAGQMPIKDGKIKPDTSKGEVIIHEKDGLLIFQWTNLDKNIPDEPIAIFSDEWEWNKIPSTKGRIYQLKSKCFEDAQHYFWMQSPNVNQDSENEKNINKLFQVGNFSILNQNFNEKEKEDKNEITGFNNFNNQEQKNNDNISKNNSNNNNNNDFIRNFTSSMNNLKSKF